MVYSGTFKAGRWKAQPLDVVLAFRGYGAYITGKIDEETYSGIVAPSCPAAGACCGMYTANTMVSAIEERRKAGQAIHYLRNMILSLSTL